MKSIKKTSPKNKRVLLRVDFNVPILSASRRQGKEIERSLLLAPAGKKVGSPLDDFRIRAVLPTIEYLLKKAAKVILISHRGRPLQNKKPKTKNKKHTLKIKRLKNLKTYQEFSLEPIARSLRELLQKEIRFIDDCIGRKVEEEIAKIKPGEVVMLENLRFYEGEEKNDRKFAKELARLADFYVNDAFSVCHRTHASVVAITHYLPSYSGLLLEKEIENLSKVLKKPRKPCILVLGGAKISTKLNLIKYWLKSADFILLGGALANTVLKSLGFEVGESLVEEKMLSEAEKIMKSGKIVLPQDLVTEKRVCGIDEVSGQEKILDLGPKTTKLFNYFIKKARLIIWNGPLGCIEKPRFAKSSLEIAKVLAKSRGFSVAGGGETLIVLREAGLMDKLNFVSTGGGAMIEFLSGKKLPGIAALEKSFARRLPG